MSLVQILVIWGAASAALFSFPVQSGEWENYQALKQALVKSNARRDVPLPTWAASLEYPRGIHFYDAPKREQKHETPNPVIALPSVPSGPISNDASPVGTALR